MPTIKGFSIKDGKVVKGEEELFKVLPIRPIKSEVVKEHKKDVDYSSKKQPISPVKIKKIEKYRRKPRKRR